MTQDEQIKALKETIQWFKKQIEPHDCGWMHSTIAGLNHRIKFLKKEIKRIDPRRLGSRAITNIRKIMTNGKKTDANTIKS